MTPPPAPAEPFANRIFLGPALRTQSDRRLVKLVREGYEAAFEEIVRRYRNPLDRFAASFVGNRSEDVTQDALSKALLALRGSENEIELRPWLYRIVRNTALNDIRDRPPTVEQLEETLAGGESAAVEAERREEMTELVERLRALPEPQRAAIVMRELEGLSHDEIAAALGVSGGAARQTIFRARMALRNGLGMLLPLPLLRMLFEHGAAADAAGGAAAAAGMAGAATAGNGAALGGIGAGTALKAGLATVLVAGSVGAAGVAIENQRTGGGGPEPAEAAVSADPRGGEDDAGGSGGSSGPGSGEREQGEDRDDSSGRGSSERGDDRGSDDDRRDEDRSGRGDGETEEDNSGRNRGRGGDDDDDDRSGGEERSGSSISGSGKSGSGSSGSDSDDDSSGSGSNSDDDDAYVAPVTSESSGVDDDDSGGSGSGSSGWDDFDD